MVNPPPLRTFALFRNNNPNNRNMKLTQNEINDVRYGYAWVKEAIKFFEQNPDSNHLSSIITEMEYAIKNLKPVLENIQEKQ